MASKIKVNIYKTTYGSDPVSMGETSLSYTEGISDFARNMCTVYADSKGELSPDYSTFMMLYDPFSDRYVFTHIQGQEWVFDNGVRKYPYRGAYEIGREDYLKNNLTGIIDSLPRINPTLEKQGKVSEVSEIQNIKPNIPEESLILASNIKNALSKGKYLYVKLNNSDSNLRENALFESSSFNTIIRAIDSLPVDFKKYTTFSFLADGNFEGYFKRCAVNFVLSNVTIPSSSDNTVIMNWDDAVSKQATKVGCMPPIPENENGLQPIEEVLKNAQYMLELEDIIAKGAYSKVSMEDWSKWLKSGHSMTSLVVNDRATYEELAKVFENLDLNRQKDEKSITKSFAQAIITPDFILNQKNFNKDDILFWEKQISSNGQWTVDLVAYIWSMWGILHLDTLSTLIEYTKRNKLSSKVISNYTCNNGLGKLPKEVDPWALTRIFQYISDNYDLSKAENLPIISKAIAEDDSLDHYMSEYIERTDEKFAKSLVQEYDQYIENLNDEEKLAFVKDSKSILFPMCDHLEEVDGNDDLGERLKKKCQLILNPNRKRNIQLTASCLFGVLLGVILTLGGLWGYNNIIKPGESVAEVVGGENEGGGDTETPNPIVQYSQTIANLGQLSQLYFSSSDGEIVLADQSLSIDSISDVSQMYDVLKDTTSVTALKCLVNVLADSTDTGQPLYSPEEYEISKDNTLFAILKDLPKGSRLDHIVNPDDETKKLVDVPNSRGFNSIVGELPNGECPLTYYFWLIQYLESSPVKKSLQEIKIAY